VRLGVTHEGQWRPSFSTTLVLCALFIPRVVDGAYAGGGRAEPAALHVLFMLWFSMSLAAWFWGYCREQRVEWTMDMGWFVMTLWIVVIPYFVIRREGRRGLLRVGLFLLTYVAAWSTGWATAIWTRLLFGRG
jgi:hypothetical protein